MSNRENTSEEKGRPRARRNDSLRARAEKTLRKTRLEVAALAPAEVQRLFHELQVHQIELKMQNEQLQTAARDLEDARAQYKSLYDHAPVGYLGLDAKGVIERANEAASDILSVEHRKLTGKTFASYVDPRDLRVLNEHLRIVRNGGSHSCEVRLVAGDENAPYAKLETSAEGTPGTGYRMVLVDISERKKAEHALRKLNGDLEERVAARTVELAHRNRELEHEILSRIQSEQERSRLEARLREAERLEGLGLMAGGIAHDFNNLLVGVISNADFMLEDQEVPQHVREGLELVKRAGVNAADLARQMLVYAGHGNVPLVPLDLQRAATDALGLLRGRVPPTIELVARFDPRLPAIEGDDGQIQQVVTNLVMNAVEAIGGATGRIVVSGRVQELDATRLSRYSHRNDAEPGAFVVLRIEDDGPGMDAATLARVFDPFFTTKVTGRGLGLASVFGIVRGHRAALGVESELGKGTAFEIAWPIANAPVAVLPPKRVSTRARWKTSGRVLVIDDNTDVRNAVACQLGLLGLETVEAPSGEEGLDLFRAGAAGFVLAVIDRTMPGLTGEETIAALLEIAPNLPIILMSGYPGRNLVLPNARVRFLQKPASFDQLRDLVRSLLDPVDGDYQRA